MQITRRLQEGQMESLHVVKKRYSFDAGRRTKPQSLPSFTPVIISAALGAEPFIKSSTLQYPSLLGKEEKPGKSTLEDRKIHMPTSFPV